MKKTITTVFVIFSAVGSAQAQLHKCTAPNGKVTYSDVMCATTAQTVQTLDATPQRAVRNDYQPRSEQRPQANVYEREISGKIGAHLLQNNFERAEALAVTPEHYQMIADARRNKQNHELEKKAAEQAARPVVCKTYGQSSGVALNIGGGLTTYSGASSGKTVCKQ